MKTKKVRSVFFFVLLCLIIFSSVKGQTYFSGGIYSNTTWTKANSPYIIIDTSVVFPGVTLTIEPGVVIKFDSAVYLEIRQATLIALGTITDSITFTSNSLNPAAGDWKGIYFNNPVVWQDDYCVYSYAENAINLEAWVAINPVIRHSSFYYNTNCVPQNDSPTHFSNCSFYNNNVGIGYMGPSFFVDSCIFMNNSTAITQQIAIHISNSSFIGNGTGVSVEDGPNIPNIIKNSIFCNNGVACGNSNRPDYQNGVKPDTIANCNFSHNHIAYSGYIGFMTGNIFADNDTGIVTYFDTVVVLNNDLIFHNHNGIVFSGPYPTNKQHIVNTKICNNTPYNLTYTGVSNSSFPNTCWCDTDSAAIAAKIYDGYDNVIYGLIKFTPYINCDSSSITALQPINCQTLVLTGIAEKDETLINNNIVVYPNPALDRLTVISRIKNVTALYLCDLTGRIILEKTFSAVAGENKIEMDVSGVAKGVYFLNAGSEGRVVKVVIE